MKKQKILVRKEINARLRSRLVLAALIALTTHVEAVSKALSTFGHEDRKVSHHGVVLLLYCAFLGASSG